MLLITLLFLYFNIKVPYYIGARDLLATVFMLTGFYFKRQSFSFEHKPLITILAGCAVIVAGVAFWPCSMSTLTWQKLIPFYISALFGTYMLFALCNWLKKWRLIKQTLIYIGNRTIDILTWHFLSFKIVSCIIIFLYGLSAARLAEFPVIEDFSYKGWWVVYLFVGIMMSLLIEIILSYGQKWITPLFISSKGK